MAAKRRIRNRYKFNVAFILPLPFYVYRIRNPTCQVWKEVFPKVVFAKHAKTCRVPVGGEKFLLSLSKHRTDPAHDQRIAIGYSSSDSRYKLFREGLHAFRTPILSYISPERGVKSNDVKPMRKRIPLGMARL